MTADISGGVHAFAVAVETGVGARPFMLRLKAARPEDEPLAVAIGTAWGGPISDFLERVRERRGQGWEGTVGWYPHGDEEDPPPGHVLAYYFDGETILPEAEFDLIVRALALFHLEVARSQGVDGPEETAIRAFLAAGA